jgi:hypothetical protein
MKQSSEVKEYQTKPRKVFAIKYTGTEKSKNAIIQFLGVRALPENFLIIKGEYVVRDFPGDYRLLQDNKFRMYYEPAGSDTYRRE